MVGRSPGVILYDAAGNPVSVVLDGSNYRLRAETKSVQSTVATRTTVVSSASDLLLLASNANRLGVIIYNNSDSPLFVGLGATTVTLTNFTFVVSANSEYDFMFNFTGQLRALWETESGEAYITELT